MQNLMRRFLVVSGLTAIGITSWAGVSHAGTATLQASQTINIDCLFNNTSYSNPSGTVAFNSTGAIAQSITWTGTVGVSCNHSGNVQISATPYSAGGYSNGGFGGVLTARSLSTYTGEYLSVNGTNIWKNGSYTANSSVTLTPNSNIPYTIALVTNPGTTGPGLPNGTYNYYFTLTATPN
jgi:spore coat protein U-like protein